MLLIIDNFTDDVNDVPFNISNSNSSIVSTPRANSFSPDFKDRIGSSNGNKIRKIESNMKSKYHNNNTSFDNVSALSDDGNYNSDTTSSYIRLMLDEKPNVC